MIKLFLIVYDKDRELALRLFEGTWLEACEILETEFNGYSREMTFPQVDEWLSEVCKNELGK